MNCKADFRLRDSAVRMDAFLSVTDFAGTPKVTLVCAGLSYWTV